MPCDVECALNPTSAAWKDLVTSKWRNRIFQAAGGATNPTSGTATRSCCDLQVKRDYAVAMRRTGQIISTRNTNQNTYPACPSGYTDGRSNCRDCSADTLQSISSPLMGDFTPVGGPNCSAVSCVEQARFGMPIPGDMCSPLSYHEGTGCIASNGRAEFFYYNPNWAGPGYSILNRWTAGVQVRSNTHGGPVPPANGQYQQNYGWSTFGTQDEIDDPNTTGTNNCVNIHPATDTCVQICKDSSHRAGGISPAGSPSWNYPQHMFAQGIVAGVDTTIWLQQPETLNDEAFSGETCGTCAELNAQSVCAHNLFQGAMPNGGQLTYSCIYAGRTFNGSSFSRDKYGYCNSYRGGVNLQLGSCGAAGPSMAQVFNYRDPSKPWGPYHIFINNSLGNPKDGVYPDCHCCAPSDGTQIGPPGTPMVSDPVAGTSLALGLDPLLGTYFGMPFESNMHCKGDPKNSYYQCPVACSEVMTPGSGLGPSAFAATFCAYHPPRSVASTRMAFAMVRADHRNYDGGGTQLTPPGKCGAYPESPNGGPSYYKDDSQWIPCNGNNPVIRNDMVLHIWGSLWDPCPPWPRVCACINPSTLLISGCELGSNYTSPCDEGHPEGSANTDGGALKYPQWTKVPASNTTRSPAKGQWVSGTWTAITGPGAGNETAGPNTRYCPECEGYETQWVLSTPEE